MPKSDDELFAIANTAKDAGNERFKKGDNFMAAQHYARGLSCIDMI